MKTKSSPAQKKIDDQNIKDIVREVNEAENAFAQRWAMATLALVNPKLHDLLGEQIAWFRESAITNDDPANVVEEGGATIRGFDAATEAMSDLTETIVIQCDAIGGKLFIGHALDHDLANGDIVITPAEIVSWIKAYPILLDLKREWPTGVMTLTQTGETDLSGNHQVDVAVDHHGETVVADQRVT